MATDKSHREIVKLVSELEQWSIMEIGTEITIVMILTINIKCLELRMTLNIYCAGTQTSSHVGVVNELQQKSLSKDHSRFVHHIVVMGQKEYLLSTSCGYTCQKGVAAM